MHAEMNNLPDETSEKVIGRFEKLVFDIRDKNPDIQVFVPAILPREVNLFPGAVNKLKFLHHENKSV